MHARNYLSFIILIFGLLQSVNAQTDSCLTVRIVKKGKQQKERPKMYTYNSRGFRLYKNCVYDFSLITGERYESQLLDIRQDTLIFKNYFNESVAKKNNQKLDTLYLNYRTILKLHLVIDEQIKLFKNIELDEYDFLFQADTMDCELPVYHIKAHPGDTNKYEVVPFLTQTGLRWMYEHDGKVYYYTGQVQFDTIMIDRAYHKKAVWFIPPFDTKVDEINGLALGFIAAPSNFRDSLRISGLCIELLPAGLLAPFFGSFLGSNDYVFSELPEPKRVNISGVTLSTGGVLMEVDTLSGFYIGGGTTWVNALHGFSLSGINTIAAESKGVSISGLRSQIRKVKGVQIALSNSCVELHGVQIGLLNITQKRTTMFFNWER